MTIAPYALLRVSLNGGAVQTGGITAVLGDSVQLSADPAGLPGATSVRFEIYDYPVGFSVPVGWSTDSTSVFYYVGTTPPAFTSAPWGKFMLRLKLNGGISNVASIPATQLADEATAIRVRSPNGVTGPAAGETSQWGGPQAWVADMKADAQLLEDALAGGGGGGGTSTDAIKDPVFVISRTTLTLSGLQTIDGVSVPAGKRVAALAQPGGIASGIYVTAVGAWARATDWDVGATPKSGCSFKVVAGDHAGAEVVLDTVDPIVVGTTSVSFSTRPFVNLTGVDGMVIGVASEVAAPTKVSNAHITDNTIAPAKLDKGSGNEGKVLGIVSGLWAFLTATGHTIKNELGAAVTARAALLGSWLFAGDDGTNTVIEEHVRLARVNVNVVPTANQSNLSAISASQNGVSLVRGNVVWLCNQTTTSENGFYRFATGGILTRITEIDALSDDAAGTNGATGVYVRVIGGTSGKAAGTYWNVTSHGATQVATQIRKPRVSFYEADIEDYQLSTENLIAGSENFQPADARALECLTAGKLHLRRRGTYRITARLKNHRPVTRVGKYPGRVHGTVILCAGCGAHKDYANISTNSEAPDSLGPGGYEGIQFEYTGTFAASTAHIHGGDTLTGLSVAAGYYGFPGYGLRIYGDSSAPTAVWNSSANFGSMTGSIFSCGLSGVRAMGADGNAWNFTGVLFSNNGLLLSHPSITNGSAFDNAAWTKGAGVTVTADVDGTADALTVSGSATSANTFVSQNIATCVANATGNPPVTLTLKTRYVDVQWICVETDVGASANRTWIDIQNGTIGTSGANHDGRLKEPPFPAAPTISAVGATLANYRDISLSMVANASGTAVYRIYLCSGDGTLTPPSAGGIVRATAAAIPMSSWCDWNAQDESFLGNRYAGCLSQGTPGAWRMVGASQKGVLDESYVEGGGGNDIAGSNKVQGGRGSRTLRSDLSYVPANAEIAGFETDAEGMRLSYYSQASGNVITRYGLVGAGGRSMATINSEDSTGWTFGWQGTTGGDGVGHTWYERRGSTNNDVHWVRTGPSHARGAGLLGGRTGLLIGGTAGGYMRVHSADPADLPANDTPSVFGNRWGGSWLAGDKIWRHSSGPELLWYLVSNVATALTWGVVANPSEGKGADLTDGDATLVVSGGSYRVMPAGTLTQARTGTLGTTGAKAGHQITLRIEPQSFPYTVTNGGGGGGSTVLPAGFRHVITSQSDATNWSTRLHSELALDKSRVALTAQTASIGATNLFSAAPAKGEFEITVYLQCTTADAGAVSVLATIGWTDEAGATTDVTSTLALTATGRTQKTFLIRTSGSANITYATTVTTAGTSQYALHVVARRRSQG